MSNSSETINQSYAKDPAVFDEVVVGIFRSSKEGKYEYVNQRLAELYGYDSTNDLIKAIGDIEGQLYVDSNQRELFLELIQAQGRIEQTQVLHLRHTRLSRQNVPKKEGCSKGTDERRRR